MAQLVPRSILAAQSGCVAGNYSERKASSDNERSQCNGDFGRGISCAAQSRADGVFLRYFNVPR